MRIILLDESNIMSFFPSFLNFASFENSLVGKKFGHNTVLVLDRLQFRHTNSRKLYYMEVVKNSLCIAM